MHRIHTARLLRFPLLWAVVTLDALPLQITWYDVAGSERLTSSLRERIVISWRGLTKLGLVEGFLDANEGELQPVWVAAPWLLAKPDDAVLWAQNYERVYPGALARLGISAAACRDPDSWQDWLASASS